MLFRALKLQSWRQFNSVDIVFHRHMTILTGANGAGKTTILNILSRYFGWPAQVVGSRRITRDSAQYSSDTWSASRRDKFKALLDLSDDDLDKLLESDDFPEDDSPNVNTEIGSIEYDNGTAAQLGVPANIGSIYQLNIANQQPVDGLHIPSHRPIYSYQPVASIPTTTKRLGQAHSEYVNLVRMRYLGAHHPHTPNHYLKETLLGFAVFGEGNKYVAKDNYAKETFFQFQNMLRKVLPRSIGFRRLLIRVPEVILLTKTGEISLDAVSGGLASLIDISWQIFSFADKGSAFVVTFDEPENHLHPELQRNVLPNLISAFPDVQFIVATHNPFVIGSVPESNVYAFRYDEHNRVYAEFLSAANRSGTANEILREVLGLDSTSPMWVEQRINGILTRLAERAIDDSLAEVLRRELEQAGLANQMPSILAELLRRRRP
jgi:predicted ATPase